MKINILNKPECEIARNIVPFKSDVLQDLCLNKVLEMMAKNDRFVFNACKNVLLEPQTNLENIVYRQCGIKDCIKNKKTIFSLYNTVAEVVTDMVNYKDRMKKKGNPSPAIRVIDSISMLDLLAGGLEKLKAEITNTYGHFQSSNFTVFYDDFLKEFDPNFMQMVHQKKAMLQALQVGGEIQISAQLGAGMKSEHFLVNALNEYQSKRKFDKIESLFNTMLHKEEVRISFDDLRLSADCKELESAGLYHIAQHFDSFSKEIQKMFDSLRLQLAFFYGCYNLHTHMVGMTFPVCFPHIEKEPASITAQQLYDLSLAISSLKMPVTNDLEEKDTSLYLITGTNHGGKTTFLRSVGIAQMMCQCGMFVPAKSMSTSIFQGVFTHFVRNEDVTMTSGKLEEELLRLSKIIDHLKKHSLVLFNESFATTSEREGANIAEDIIRAFYDNQITCFFVTHIYAFAKKAFETHLEHTVFYQAERLEDGRRTYVMRKGEPSITGYGMDLYREVIGELEVLPK